MKRNTKSLFKKVLSITLSLSLLVAMFAISSPHTHAATQVSYQTDSNGKKVGISEIVIDGKTYYDIFGGSTSGKLDDYLSNEVGFYIKALTASDTNGSTALGRWSLIAKNIFKSAGANYAYSADKDFDDFFDQASIDLSTGQIDLAAALNQIDPLTIDASWDGDSGSEGNVYISGLTYVNSLKAAEMLMAEKISTVTATDGEVVGKPENTASVEEILERCADDSLADADDGEAGYVYMNDTTNQTVLTSMVTTHDFDSSISSFGLAFYDFELVPLLSDEIQLVTAADGYNSLEDAAKNGVAGVTYNTDNTKAPEAYNIANKTASEATLSASYEETNSTTVSNWMESSETYSFSESISTTSSFSASFPFGEISQSTSLGFTAEQAISTAYGSENSITTETTAGSTVDVTLPPHTQLATTITRGTTEMSVTYDCPVVLTYKTAVFSMHSSSENGEGAGGMCTIFGAGNSIGGVNATESLYFRAIDKVDLSGFERTQGRFVASFDKDEDGDSPAMKYELDWSGVTSDIETELNIETLYNYIPLSAAGGKMSLVSTSMNADVVGIVPLYDLDYVQVAGNSVFTIAPNGTVDFSKINTGGYNAENIEYYGYVSAGGTWVLCDADGNELTSIDGVTFNDVSNYKVFSAQNIGTYYAKFLIDETLYAKVDGSGYIKNSDLSNTAIVTINVTNTGLDHICVEGPWQTTITPSCTSTGEQIACCGVCGGLMYTQTLPKSDHIPVTITTPSTCLTEGNEKTFCGKCLSLIKSETFSKLPHDNGVWKIDFEATADHPGQMTRYCTACGTALESKEFELHTHTLGYESILREPTCVSHGEKGIFCLICNVMYATEQIEKSGHGTAVSIIGKDADCTHDGETYQYCTDCGELIGSNVIPSHGHAGAWITVKEATCSAVGREENVCTICDAVLETREIAKTEHIPGKWEITQQPTCTQAGLMQQICALCDALIGEPVVIDAHDHDNGAWKTVLEPTCTTDGEKVRECTICKGTFESEIIPALGHDGGVWTTALEATCETQGEKHLNCTRCGQLIDSERIDAVGHVPGPAATCVYDQVCLVCEEVLAPADGRSHTWTDWTTYKKARFFVEEQQRRFCTSCNEEEYRFVTGTSKCHKYFPHCDGSGENCWACKTLSGSNNFFRNLGKFLTWFFTENIILHILFPYTHGHFHEKINTEEIFGS